MALTNIDFHVFSLKLKLLALGHDLCVFGCFHRKTLVRFSKNFVYIFQN